MIKVTQIEAQNEPEAIQEIVSSISKYDDQTAFKKFFDIYYPKLLNYAYYILESRQDADEVVSGLFVKIWDQRKKLPDIKNLDAYLYTSIKNLCYNYLRDNKESFLKTLEVIECKFIPALENPEKQYLDMELKEKILEAMEELPPRCKLIFRMVREDGLKYAEVATLLELSVKTVEVQMGRAFSKMRAELLPFIQNEDIKLNFLNDKRVG
ncbi:MAG: RNA polymerase sigma-70 factor (family 1) [Cyclobacteriaceae bacterium]